MLCKRMLCLNKQGYVSTLLSPYHIEQLHNRGNNRFSEPPHNCHHQLIQINHPLNSSQKLDYILASALHFYLVYFSIESQCFDFV